MGRKILDNKILYVILSVILAIILWFYVCMVQGDVREKQIENIQITFLGTDVLQENGLMLSGDLPTVNITLSASMTTLPKLSADTITLKIDVSQLSEPGSYTMGYEISYPSGVSSSMVTIVEQDPINVKFTVEQYASVQVPIRGELVQSGEGPAIADGFVGGEFEFNPSTITVSGQADLVEQVEYALVTLSGENLSETVQEAMTYQLIGADNLPLEGLNVVCSPSSIDTTFPILKEIEVPLVPEFIAGGGATADHVTSWSIEPSMVSVLGNPEDLESLQELTIAIDLAKVDGTQTWTTPIPLADGLAIQGGISEATISVTIEGLSTKTFEIDPRTKFTIISETIPEGYTAEIRTRTMAVTVRGTESALELASESNIRGTIDLSNINVASGQYTVPVNIQFDGTGGAGVFGGANDYQVVVRLAKK